MKLNVQELEYAKSVVEGFKTSKDKHICYPDSRPIVNLKHMWETSVEIYGEKVAFHVKDKLGAPYREVTYKQANSHVEALGTALIEKGLKNKKIGIIGDNCYQWAISYLAVAGGVGVVVPLDKELPGKEIKDLIKEAEVECIIYSSKYSDVFLSLTEENFNNPLKLLVNMNIKENKGEEVSFEKLKEEGGILLQKGNKEFLEAEIQRDAMGVLLFTSGTTGLAKGVMLSHGNIVEDLMSAPTLLKVTPEEIFFSVLPIHHTYECTCGFLMPLYKGASIAYCEGLKYIVKNLSEVRPTFFLGVPLIFESLYKKIWQNVKKSGKEATLKKAIEINRKTKKIGLDIGPIFFKKITSLFGGRMRMMICGGAAIDPAILQGLRDFGIPALQGYGLTECSPMCALNPDQYINNEAAGYPLPGTEIKIHEPNSETGIGEICMKGKNIMLGYYNNEEATAEVLIDGWFHSGDLGYLNDEGYVIITGRKKNVIITKNGKNVFPEEIEFYLGKVSFVEESFVWGKDTADGKDTIIAATIKVDENEVKDILGDEYTDADLEALLWKEIDIINNDLPFFKRVKALILRKRDFEKTTGKKIKRFVESNKES